MTDANGKTRPVDIECARTGCEGLATSVYPYCTEECDPHGPVLGSPYYSDELVTLYHRDCADVLPLVDDADLIFTSPPYNLGATPWPNLGNWKPGDSLDGKSKWRNGSDGVGGITYDEHSDTLPWRDYVEWQHACLRLMWDSLSPTGAIFYNHKPRCMGGRLWLPLELNPGLPLRQIVIWARSGGLNYNPTAFLPTHEWVMVFAREAWRLKSRAAAGIGGGDVWRVTQDGKNPHPAPFPLALPATAIEATEPALVVDPFAGSGTTLIAARQAGVRAIGIEKSERYCEMAAERLACGQPTLASADSGRSDAP